MSAVEDDFIRVVRDAFEEDFEGIMKNIIHPPEGTTDEEKFRHFGWMCYRIAFMKGLSTGSKSTAYY